MGPIRRVALHVGALLGLSTAPAWAGGACRSNVDCARGHACQDEVCVDCSAFRPETCLDGAFRGRHACAELWLADLRQGAGLCAAICDRQTFDLDTCNDSAVLSSVCGAVEVEAWQADLQALVALRAGDDADALLPEAEITSTCFALTQGQEPPSEQAEVLVPSPGPNGEGCLDDQGMVVDGCLEDAGERTTVKRELYGREGQVFDGFASHYYGLRMQDMTRASSAAPGNPFADFGFDLQRAIWNQNGDRVESCAEYVYESYYNYSRFEDAIRGMGNDYWRIWQTAFAYAPVAISRGLTREAGVPKAAGGAGFVAAKQAAFFELLDYPDSAIGTLALAGRPLTARNGDPIEPQPEMRSLYKPNPWFRILGFSAPDEGRDCGLDLFNPTICDDALREAVNEALRNDPPENTQSFAWHYRKGAALRAQGIIDDELAFYQALTERMTQIRERRSTALARVKAIMLEIYGVPPRPDLLFQEIQFPIPDFEEVYSNPAVLDAQITAARPAGAARVSAKNRGFELSRAGVGQIGQTATALQRGEALSELLANHAQRLSLGQGGPSGQWIAYSRSGPERSDSRARTGGDHLAAWREADPRASQFGQAAQAVDVDQVYLRLAQALEGLYAVERELEAIVAEGYAEGCFRTDIGNPCGWTPKLFAELVLELYGEREALYQRCLDETAREGFAAMVGESFVVNLDPDQNPHAGRYPWFDATPYQWPPDPYYACYSDAGGFFPSYDEYPGFFEGVSVDLPPACPGCNDWARDTTHVTRWLTCKPRWERLLLNMVQEAVGDLVSDTGVAQLLDRVGEWWQVGNDDFGAYAGYGFGWAIGEFQEYVQASGEEALRCNLAPEMYGHFDLAARVFGGNVDIIDASAHLRFGDNPTVFPGGLPVTPQGRPTVEQQQIDIEALGQSIFHEDFVVEADGFNIISGTEGLNEEIFSISAIFTIGFVPVTVSAGLAGIVGLQYDVGGAFPAFNEPGSCTLIEARGQIGPYAGINAFASASINAVIAEVGVKIELTLIRLDLPLIGRVALEMKPGGVVNLLAEMRLDLVLSLLSGRVLLFLRIAWESWELELFSWDGPRFTTNLFDLRAAVPLADLARALQPLVSMEER